MSSFLLVPLSLSLVQAGAVFLRLCAKNCSSAEEHHGCLVKEHRKVAYYEKEIQQSSASNVERCAENCAERSECDSFDLHQNKCRLFRKGNIDRGSVSFTAGFCPKGVFSSFKTFRKL